MKINKFELSMSNFLNNSAKLKLNTARFKITKREPFCILIARKLFIFTGYHHENISGMLELNVSLLFNESILNAKIVPIASTKTRKCFNVSFEHKDDGVELVLRYNGNYNNITVLDYMLSTSFNESKLADCYLTDEDISQITDWY